jgi:hypothetical protein
MLPCGGEPARCVALRASASWSAMPGPLAKAEILQGMLSIGCCRLLGPSRPFAPRGIHLHMADMQ